MKTTAYQVEQLLNEKINSVNDRIDDICISQQELMAVVSKMIDDAIKLINSNSTGN